MEAADEKANQAADAGTQDGGGGHGGGTHGNERGTNFLSCTRGCCAWGGGARTFCVKCCSNPEEAHDNTKNEPHAWELNPKSNTLWISGVWVVFSFSPCCLCYFAGFMQMNGSKWMGFPLIFFKHLSMPQLANFITSTASLHTLWDPASFLYNILSVPINIYLKNTVQRLLIKFPEKKKKKKALVAKMKGRAIS